MKQKLIIICAAALLFTACNNSSKTEGTATTADSPKTEAKTESKPAPDSATMQKNLQDYMTPGAMQAMMAKWDGSWDGEISWWMQPGAPEQKNKAGAVYKMVLNGLYQEGNYSGDMAGMPFSGKSLTAFDNHLKEFVSTWADNMGSGIMVLKGPWDEATKTMTLKGKMVDPATKELMDVRETLKIIDDNTQEMEMFIMLPDGKEFKSMRIQYKRKK